MALIAEQGEPPGNDGLRFSLLAVHPDAARQPTERGRILSELEAWNGRLYIGYGDTTANTGPIAVVSFDPATSSFVREWVSDTEAIYNYRPIGSHLYAPASDRRQSADYARGAPWSDYLPVGTTHAFDIVTLTGDDLWLVGSLDVNATAWRSTDGGRTWSVALSEGPTTSFSRFYFGGVYKGKLYVQAVDSEDGPSPTSKVFDGSGWADGPALLSGRHDTGWRPETFAGNLVYTTRGQTLRLMRFDGSVAAEAVRSAVIDFSVIEGRALVALAGGGRILYTEDLSSWKTIGTAPSGSSTIEVIDGFVYVGASEARLFRSSQRLQG